MLLRPTTVDRLLARRGPSAISWLVASIIVTTVNGVAGTRPTTHVGVERSEAGAPSRTHGDSPQSVEPCILTVGQASVDHVSPSSVFDALRHAVGSCACGCLLGLPASATRGVAAAQIRADDDGVRSAGTLTAPRRLAETRGTGSLKNQQARKTLASQILHPASVTTLGRAVAKVSPLNLRLGAAIAATNPLGVPPGTRRCSTNYHELAEAPTCDVFRSRRSHRSTIAERFFCIERDKAAYRDAT